MSMEKLFSQFVKATEPNDRKVYLTSVFYSLFHLAVMWYVYVRRAHTAPYAMVIVHMVFVGVLFVLILSKDIMRPFQRMQALGKAPAESTTVAPPAR